MQHSNGVRSSLSSGLPFTLFCGSSSQGVSLGMTQGGIQIFLTLGKSKPPPPPVARRSYRNK